MKNKFFNPARIGMSVSFCISDIAMGEVDIDDVEVIIASTQCWNRYGWFDLIDRYKTTYWARFPKQAEAILYELLNAGKIEQPRLLDAELYPFVGNGHWAATPEEIEWDSK